MKRLFLCPILAFSAWAETPVAKPLAEFDRIVEQLCSARVVGEPVAAGSTTVVPFAAVQFGLGSAAAPIATGGGMGGKVVPLGVLIVEGDDVRMSRSPSRPSSPD